MLLILNVIYVLVAIAMIALILMQRGAGAQAGSGFGSGASATVFGSRGASNFLTKATKWLAIVFFAISMYMAWQASSRARGDAAPAAVQSEDLGVAADIAVPKAAPQGGAAPVPTAPVPTAPVPTAPAPGAPVPAAPAPVQNAPASDTGAPAQAAPAQAPAAQPAAPAAGGAA